MTVRQDGFVSKKADYQIGDEVWLRGTVRSLRHQMGNGPVYELHVLILSSQEYGNAMVWVRPKHIVRHIPAPRPIEVGCFVTGGAAGSNWYQVRAVHGNYAWIECVGLHEIVSLSKLMRMPEEEVATHA